MISNIYSSQCTHLSETEVYFGRDSCFRYPKHLTVMSLIKNTIHCLDKVNRDHKYIVDKIFQFSVAYFKCWRKVVMSNGTNILKVTIDTTK